MPVRIQRQRTKGWRMPEGAVYVGRPTIWGNNYRVGQCKNGRWESCCDHQEHPKATIEDVMAEYREIEEILNQVETEVFHPVDRYEDIRGKDLACWCPLDRPCHADILLELANR